MAERAYTLFSRGQKIVSSDNLPWLEEGLTEFESTRSTYIRFNETGVHQYAENKRWDEPDTTKVN